MREATRAVSDAGPQPDRVAIRQSPADQRLCSGPIVLRRHTVRRISRGSYPSCGSSSASIRSSTAVAASRSSESNNTVRRNRTGSPRSRQLRGTRAPSRFDTDPRSESARADHPGPPRSPTSRRASPSERNTDCTVDAAMPTLPNGSGRDVQEDQPRTGEGCHAQRAFTPRSDAS